MTWEKESPEREKQKGQRIYGLTYIIKATQMGIKLAKSGQERDVYIPSDVALFLRLM